MSEWIIHGAAFLIGGLCPCWIAVKLVTGKDLREEDSGNVGASNAARSLGMGKHWFGWIWYFILIILDALKGFCAIKLAESFSTDTSFIAFVGFSAVLGHCFPIYLKFKRGKGISTTLGVLLSLGFYSELAVFISALVLGLLGTRRPSAAALIALATLVLTNIAYGHFTSTNAIVCTVVLIVIRHHDNIDRLLKGIEPPLFNWHN